MFMIIFSGKYYIFLQQVSESSSSKNIMQVTINIFWLILFLIIKHYRLPNIDCLFKNWNLFLYFPLFFGLNRSQWVRLLLFAISALLIFGVLKEKRFSKREYCSRLFFYCVCIKHVHRSFFVCFALFCTFEFRYPIFQIFVGFSVHD